MADVPIRPEKPRHVEFSFSEPPSISSSRSGSPAPSMASREDFYMRKTIQQDDPGCRPMDVYDATLPPWRAAVRRKLLATIRNESVLLAKMQDAIRTPWLDAYFVHSSALGTHTFFMTFLPMLFFFGYDELGRGLIIVIGLGIYLTSVVKDLFCSPRPFAPPVTRMTIGTHHLEYGMPSTHSANSVSLALFFFALIHPLAFPVAGTAPALSVPVYVALTASLVIYATSIVFGRLYTAMHSFTDCAVGVAIGVLVWIAHSSFRGIAVSLALSPAHTYSTTLLRGWGWGAYVDEWILRTPSSLRVPLTLIPLGLLAVNQHPQPVDDCPCFEDAIAIGSVMLGMLVGRWGAVRWGMLVPTSVMPGSGWVLGADGWAQVPRGWGDVGVWWALALGKMIFGIAAIFIWRLLAKAALHRALPPTFRFLATLMRLPHRRFYTPATEYARVPPGAALRPIPSVIDLPSTAGVEIGGIGSGSGIDGDGSGNGKGGLRRRAEAIEAARPSTGMDDEDVDDGSEVKHYDADVLTKVIVYAGIAVIACELMPLLFQRIGWGLRSSP